MRKRVDCGVDNILSYKVGIMKRMSAEAIAFTEYLETFRTSKNITKPRSWEIDSVIEKFSANVMQYGSSEEQDSLYNKIRSELDYVLAIYTLDYIRTEYEVEKLGELAYQLLMNGFEGFNGKAILVSDEIYDLDDYIEYVIEYGLNNNFDD